MEEPIKGLSSKLQPTPAGQRARKPLGTHTSKEPLLKVSFRQGELYVPSLSFEIAFWRLNLHPSFTNAFTKTCGPNDFLLWCQPLAHSLCNCLAPPHHPQVGIWKRATVYSSVCLWNQRRTHALLCTKQDIGLARLVECEEYWVNSG